MSSITQQVKTIALAAALSVGLSRVGLAQSADGGSVEKATTTVYRAKEPMKAPPLKEEAKAAAHPAHAVWIPGFWNLEGNPATAPRGGWVWVSGRWDVPPVRGAQWDDSHWGFSGGWWSWTPGHWDEPRRAG
jgi:hypothetical protein